MPTTKAIISQTIDQFADVSGKLASTTRVGVQDPDNKTRTEAATLQAIVDKGLEAHAFEPYDPAIQAHVTQVSGNPHRVNAAEVGSPTTGEFGAHVNNYNNPHQVNATDVGGGNALWNANKIQDVPVSDEDPTSGQALVFDGAQYKPGNVSGSAPEFLTFVPQDAANMQNNTLFVDSATGKLSFKDSSGAVKLMPFGSPGANMALYTNQDGDISGSDMTLMPNGVLSASQDGGAISILPTSKLDIPVAWIVYDDDEVVATTVGKQPMPVTLSAMNNYNFVDVMAMCSSPAAGTVTIDILKNDTSMMVTPLSLTNAAWSDLALDPNAEIKPVPDSTVLRGDSITYSISVTGDAPSGLSVCIILRAS